MPRTTPQKTVNVREFVSPDLRVFFTVTGHMADSGIRDSEVTLNDGIHAQYEAVIDEITYPATYTLEQKKLIEEWLEINAYRIEAEAAVLISEETMDVSYEEPNVFVTKPKKKK